MSDSSQLSKFLADLKQRYLLDVREANGKASEWTVVMGNEAGDLDTIACSIAYSWLETEVHKRQTVPLIRFDQADLALRNENIHALTLAGLTSNAQELLYLSELLESKTFPSNKFALVDHNHIGSSFTTDNPSAQVIAVIDHHEDEGLYKDTANPRIVTPAGSCSSLIAHLFPTTIPAELATLLMCAILIDTGGLKKGGKGVRADFDAAAFLVPLSTLASAVPPHLSTAQEIHDAQAIKDLANKLEAMKEDLSRLSVWDLLRRDYKEYTFQLPWADPRVTIKAGLSTVPLSLESWIIDGRLENQVKPWMESRGLAVHGVLTSYQDTNKPGKGGKGKHRKEQVWTVREGAETIQDNAPGDDPPRVLDLETLAERLFAGLEASQELELKRNKKFDIDKQGSLPAGMKARVYDQKNTDASRKIVAPTLKIILAGPGPLPEVVTVNADQQ